MKKTFLVFFSLVLLLNNLTSQSIAERDSLVEKLKTLPNDTNRVLVLNRLAYLYALKRPDSTYLLGQQAYQLSRSLNYLPGEGQSYNTMGIGCSNIGDDVKAYKLFNQSKEVFTTLKDSRRITVALSNIADMYMKQGEWQKGLDKMKEAYAIFKTLPKDKQNNKPPFLSNIGECYYNLNQLDSANVYMNQALAAEKLWNRGVMSPILYLLGDVALGRNNSGLAYDYYRQSASLSMENESYSELYEVYFRLSRYFEAGNQQDSVLYYAKQAMAYAEKSSFTRGILKTSQYLSTVYEHNNDGEALRYLKIANAAKDSLYSQDKVKQMLSLTFDEKEKAQQIENNKIKFKNTIRLYVLLGILVIFGVIAIFLVRNNRQKQKANHLLQKQKNEIDSKAKELLLQKESLEQSYTNVELLGEIGRKITASLSVEAIIDTAYDKVNSLMDASVFGIGIYHEEKQSLDFPSTYENGLPLPVYSNSIYDKARLAAICFNTGNEILIGNLDAEYQVYLQSMPVPNHGNRPLSLIYLPLKVNEKMLGVITVQSFKEHAFSDYHLYMLRNISIYAAIAIENAESFNKLNITVDSLKNTQTQLIQSEKMASLGELTAGIAHEIQNPLNFVNNFSEVNIEMLEEMKTELSTGNLQLASEIAGDLQQNLEKILHHGKRADAIVKGMLQHSRSSSGVKEPTDINALADEYLRLSYHGLRAKHKGFNAGIKTEFDGTIGNVPVIPQDIGRVLLNLYNNAFYAVQEKAAALNGNLFAGQAGYEPMVSVITKKDNGKIFVSVKDNGKGIPQKVVDKIFQPFFTTKPTGQGTGLGLSLAYDIVKAHGGEIKVETKEGEGTEFLIQLPSTG